MRSKWVKIIVFVLILVFFASLSLYKINPVSNDLGRHIKNGELVVSSAVNFIKTGEKSAALAVLTTNFYSPTDPDFPFVNHTWLSGVVFYLIHQAAGFSGLDIFKIIILLATFGVLFLVATKKADFWLVALFSLPAILVLVERTTLRPELFSYLFIAVFLLFLIDLESHPEHKRIYWLIPLELVWVNLHLFFLIGIMLVAGFLAEKIIVNFGRLKNEPMIKKLFFVLLALAAVSLINPNGAAGALYPFHIFSNYAFNVAENQSVFSFLKIEPPWRSVSVSLYEAAVLLLSASFIFGFTRKPLTEKNSASSGHQIENKKSAGRLAGKPIFYLLAGVGSAAAGFYLVRNISLMGMIFLPAVTFNFNGVLEKLKSAAGKKLPQTEKILAKILASGFALAFAVLIFLGLQGKFTVNQEMGIGLTRGADDAAAFFGTQHLKGPVFNDYDIGSYLIYHFYPTEKFFIDSRPEAFPATFLNDTYLAILASEEAWHEAEAKYQFNSIFFYHYDETTNSREFLFRRMRDPAWSLVYADIYSVIFLKNIPANQDKINKFAITRDNIGDRLAWLVNSDEAPDQIAAADLFNFVGRNDLAMASFQKVVAHWPNESRVWMIMGEMEMYRKDAPNPELAIGFLSKAIETGQRTAEAYSFLGWAYSQSGQFDKAASALTEALKINPAREDAKILLPQVKKILDSI